MRRMQPATRSGDASALAAGVAAIAALPKLGSATKLAYTLLWVTVAEGRPGSYGVHLAAFGSSACRDRRRAAEWLESLEAAGALDIADRRGGVWSLYLYDPAEAARGLRRRDPDPQREFGFAADERPASEPQAAAVAIRTAPPEDEPDDDLLRLRDIVERRRGELGRPSAAPAIAGTVASVAEGVLDARIAASTAERRARVQREILATINKLPHAPGSGQLRQAPALRVAAAVADGRLPEAELERIFQYVQESRPRVPWQVFVACCRRKFRDLRIDWGATKTERNGVRNASTHEDRRAEDCDRRGADRDNGRGH